MHATKTGKGAIGSSLIFQNLEHPRIGYFGYKKLSFDQLNVFFWHQQKDFGFGKLDQERSRTLGEQGCPSLSSIGGITCNFTPILRYFQLMGDEPRPRFCLGEQINWRPKNKVFTKRKKICSPNCSGDLRSNAHQSQIIGGMQMQTLLKLLGGTQSNYWGDIYPHPPLGVSTTLSVRRWNKGRQM